MVRKKKHIQSDVAKPIEKKSALEDIKFKYDLLSYVEKLKTCENFPFITKLKPPDNVRDFILASYGAWVASLENPSGNGVGAEPKEPVGNQEQLKPQFNQMEMQFLKQFINKAISKGMPQQPGMSSGVNANQVPIPMNNNNPPPIT